jgi:hypothetical protein
MLDSRSHDMKDGLEAARAGAYVAYMAEPEWVGCRPLRRTSKAGLYEVRGLRRSL